MFAFGVFSRGGIAQQLGEKVSIWVMFVLLYKILLLSCCCIISFY